MTTCHGNMASHWRISHLGEFLQALAERLRLLLANGSLQILNIQHLETHKPLARMDLQTDPDENEFDSQHLQVMDASALKCCRRRQCCSREPDKNSACN